MKNNYKEAGAVEHSETFECYHCSNSSYFLYIVYKEKQMQKKLQRFQWNT